jgi:Domain of unknown function (DUF4124)
MKHAFACALLTLGMALITGVSAQTVYRCGPDGRSYSDSPCPNDTKGKVVDVADKRSAADTERAQQTVQRDQALADRMRQQRENDEARALAANRNAAGIKPPPTPLARSKDKDRPEGKPKKKRAGQHRVAKTNGD